MAVAEHSLVVGIDVGMTCTGVAWATRDRNLVMSDPHVIQRWPGNVAEQRDKVPTVVCYRNHRLSSWGFLTRSEDDAGPGAETHDWFKIYLDPAEYKKAKALTSDPTQLGRNHGDVRKFYRDFLARLYKHIQGQLEDQVGNASWQSADVEFLFSVPTTWTALGVTKDFESLARDAGFGTGRNHSLSVGLTEAEAAAVYTFKTQATTYSDGDILLIVDAGGGTTDLALLRASVKPDQRPKLQQLDEVRGDEIGSTMIDIAFQDLACQRLNQLAHQLGRDRTPDDVAWDMTRKGFGPYKLEFGTEDSDRQDTKWIEVPGLPQDFSMDEVRVRRGRLGFTNNEIKGLFDEQMRRMFEVIDYQMNQMSRVAPQDQISHLVLSGGLGSSEYVKKELKRRYLSDTPNSYARNLRIITSTSPQLAVVKGLVQDRMERLNFVEPVLKTRICRMSLGVVCHQLYNQMAHRGEELEQDPVDGKTYAKNQVVWFVHKGKPVTNEAIEHKFFRNLIKDKQRQPWTDQIAISHATAALPRSLKDDGVKPLCLLKSNLTDVPLSKFEKKKRRFWQFWKSYKKTHYKATYQVKFQIKPATIDFELWFEGQKYNIPGAPSSIEAQWEEGANIASPKAHRVAQPDRSRWDN